MAINTCENHDDIVVVWSYGRECPLCKANERAEELEGQIDAARKIADELKEELDEANRNMKNMADSV